MQRFLRYFVAIEIFLKITCLLCISRNVLGQEETIAYDDELSYQELINMNASCYPADSCQQDRTDDSPVPGFGVKCSCHKQCWEYGTCCIDSPHRVKPAIQKCRKTEGTSGSYYMVHRCPENTKADSTLINQCEKEWDEEKDILMLSPVTSLDTSTTYKNYYCFMCHETTDKYVSWKIFVESTHIVSGEISGRDVYYNQSQKTWMANLDENRQHIPVNLSFQVPPDVQVKLISCDLDVIEDCPDSWTDRRVHEKCLAYTAVVYGTFSSYKNAHCALCNEVPLGDISCNTEGDKVVVRQPSVSSSTFLTRSSFSELLDIRNYECEDGYILNPFTGRCQEKVCIFKGRQMCPENFPEERKKRSGSLRFDIFNIKRNKIQCDDDEIWNPYLMICLKKTYLISDP